MEYRNDIDGLRAVAVAIIIFFHAELSNVPGGFIGVDVFFVISGFLITSFVQRDIAAGKFTFKNFYIRRLRRLGPALLATLAMTLIAGWLFLPPQQYANTAAAAIATLTSVSNIFFWWQSGYFDTDAVTKPLLHSWSLSVEEQFYLIWPGFLAICMHYKHANVLPLAVIIIACISMGAAQILITQHADAAFFLMPFRIYEFAIGGLLALSRTQARHIILSNATSLAGLMIIFYASAVFNNDLAFPGLNALLPCAGAALMIYAGPNAIMNRSLALRPVRYIGEISYSLYLVHWPIMVFYRNIVGRPETTAEISSVIVLTVAVGSLMYHLIETPFRRKTTSDFKVTSKNLLSICGIVGLSIFLTSVIIHRNSGVPIRYPADINELFTELNTVTAERLRTTREGRCNAPTTPASLYFDNFDHCLPDQRHDMIVVLGDSHAADIYVGLHALYPDRAIVQLTGNGCNVAKQLNGDNVCVPYLRHWQKWLAENQNNITAIIYGQSARSILVPGPGGVKIPHGGLLRLMDQNLPQILPADVPVFFWGPRPEFRPTIDGAIAHSPTKAALETYFANAAFQEERRLDTWYAQYFTNRTIQYQSTIETLCTPNCPTLTADGHLFTTDYAHWTTKGAQMAVRAMITANPNLSAILGPA